MTPLPPFAVTTVGSWPRPRWLLDAVKRRDPDLPALRDRATEEAVRNALVECTPKETGAFLRAVLAGHAPTYIGLRGASCPV